MCIRGENIQALWTLSKKSYAQMNLEKSLLFLLTQVCAPFPIFKPYTFSLIQTQVSIYKNNLRNILLRNILLRYILLRNILLSFSEISPSEISSSEISSSDISSSEISSSEIFPSKTFGQFLLCWALFEGSLSGIVS